MAQDGSMPRSKIALLLVGHGASRVPEAALPVLRLAEAVAARHRFAQVHAAFMKQDPPLAGALDAIDAATVVVVPVFAGRGWYTDILVPRTLGLEGALTRRDGRLIVITPPAGGHPAIPGILARRALAASAGIEAAKVSLLLIAHGSARAAGPGESGAGDSARAIGAAIAAMGRFAEVAVAFLEQEPRAADWPALLRGDEIVALPLLIAQGHHASRDIPPLFGLDAVCTGPVLSHGRQVRIATGLGIEPELVEVVIDLAESAVRA